MIRDYFANEKAVRVRSAAMGAKVNLWKAVNAAKNINRSSIPNNLTFNGLPIVGDNMAESFAKIFCEKIRINVSKTNVNPSLVYNGKCKLFVQN